MDAAKERAWMRNYRNEEVRWMKDSERLDWIEQYQPIIGWVYVSEDTRHRRVEFTDYSNVLIPRQHRTTGPDLRAAIDAAMKITGDFA